MAKADASKKWDKKGMHGGSGSGIWCLGFVGALVYFWHDITSFGSFFVVMFKAIFWPAYMVYHLFKFLAL